MELITEYRDKMNIERINILQAYAKGMYYIYDKKDNIYLISLCEIGKSHEVIKLAEEDLPPDVEIGMVLRINEGKYIIDYEVTASIKQAIEQKLNELLKEQLEVMEERRIEGHIYEFVESSEKSVWLIDNDENNGDVFEEFQREVFENAKEGDLYQYIEGEYKKR